MRPSTTATAFSATQTIFTIVFASVLASIAVAAGLNLAYAVLDVADGPSTLPTLAEFNEPSSSYILVAFASVMGLLTFSARTVIHLVLAVVRVLHTALICAVVGGVVVLPMLFSITLVSLVALQHVGFESYLPKMYSFAVFTQRFIAVLMAPSMPLSRV